MKISLNINEHGCDSCHCQEYILHNNVYTITIHCKECGDGYCIYDDGEIRRLEDGQNFTVKKIEL